MKYDPVATSGKKNKRDEDTPKTDRRKAKRHAAGTSKRAFENEDPTTPYKPTSGSKRIRSHVVPQASSDIEIGDESEVEAPKTKRSSDLREAKHAKKFKPDDDAETGKNFLHVFLLHALYPNPILLFLSVHNILFF